MLWNSYIVVAFNGKNVSVEGRTDHTVRCIGSSTDVFGGESRAASFLVTLQGERDELLAVNTNNRGSSFIFIQRKNGKAYVDEHKNWVPSGDRLGRLIDPQGYIEIRSQGKLFSTDPNASDGVFFVGDANACCKYLAGHIELEELMGAAEETQKQIDLQKRCEHLEHEAQYLQGECDRLKNLNESFSKDLLLASDVEKKMRESYKLQIESLEKKIAHQINIATQLRHAIDAPFISKIVVAEDGFFRGHWRLVFRRTLIKDALRLFSDSEK